MSKIKYALGMLATGAMAGMATHAAASTIGGSGPTSGAYIFPDSETSADDTQAFSYTVDGSIFGAAPFDVFTYHGDSHTNHLTSANFPKTPFAIAGFNPAAFSTGALPSASESFSATDITTWTAEAITADPWYHVEFTLPNEFDPRESTYLATIQIDANGNQELDQINWTTLSVPEPETWALMIMGLGATGAALRRRRAVAA